MKKTIQIFRDGTNDPFGIDEVTKSWAAEWKKSYHELGQIEFELGPNLKEQSEVGVVPEKLLEISSIRNPDLFFLLKETHELIGGIEITVHSPDGSNVEKRYPFLWASKLIKVHSLILSPYQKERLTGQKNKIPNRHAKRNIQFTEEWVLEDSQTSIAQIIPLRELTSSQLDLSEEVQKTLLSWDDIGQFFAHVLAYSIDGSHQKKAMEGLELFRTKLIALAKACIATTSYTEASSLLKLKDKWIQVYNCRPDSGHWERGEGQFDSIDGRLMFTLDEIARLPESEKPSIFEFWLPQMTSNHPWIQEQISQIENGQGSKRIKNILIELKEYCLTKFADQLSDDDWKVLFANPILLLERDDWDEGVYKISDMVPEDQRMKVASLGLQKTKKKLIGEIYEQLNRDDLYFCSHRAYTPNWDMRLRESILNLVEGAVILIPRVPHKLLAEIMQLRKDIKIIPAEDCSKLHLIVLRQLHRIKREVMKWQAKDR